LPLVSQAYFIASCEVVHLVSQHTTAAITFSSKWHLPVPLWAEFCGAVSHLDAPNGCLARRDHTAWKSEQEKTLSVTGSSGSFNVCACVRGGIFLFIYLFQIQIGSLVIVPKQKIVLTKREKQKCCEFVKMCICIMKMVVFSLWMSARAFRNGCWGVYSVVAHWSNLKQAKSLKQGPEPYLGIRMSV